MRSTLLALVLVGSASYGVSAHHSFTDRYHENRVITIEGAVVQLVSRHPHSYIYVTAPGRNGEMRVWAVECGNPRDDRQQQVERWLRPGDVVIITGSPGRDAGLGQLRMRDIVRASDGQRWSLVAR
jgi:hypothetical protein